MWQLLATLLDTSTHRWYSCWYQAGAAWKILYNNELDEFVLQHNSALKAILFNRVTDDLDGGKKVYRSEEHSGHATQHIPEHTDIDYYVFC